LGGTGDVGGDDVRAAGPEQAQLVLLAPAGELAQVQLIRLTVKPL